MKALFKVSRVILVLCLMLPIMACFCQASAVEDLADSGAAAPVYAVARDVTQVSAGGYFTAILKSDGTVWMWGKNDFDQCCTGTASETAKLTQVPGLTDITQISAGHAYTVALKADGTVWAWGRNWFGELGSGEAYGYSTKAVQVAGLAGVRQVAAGSYHGLAVKTDGTVWSWGYNEYGQLGNGTTADVYAPVQVSGLAGVDSVAAGAFSSYAVKSDGTAWSWGQNDSGQLGDGTTVDKAAPVKVSGLTGVGKISAGVHHALALLTNGALYAWGSNDNLQLGNASNDNSRVPVEVKGLSAPGSVVDISAGAYHSLAVKADGTGAAWGSGDCGVLGDGSSDWQMAPAAVSSLTNVFQLDGGYAHTVALSGDGTVWCCGDNRYGLVPGTEEPFPNVPVQDKDIEATALMTRGGIAVVLDGLMHFNAKAPNIYTDLGQATEADALQKAVAAGLIEGNGTLMLPNKALTREDAAVILAKALGIGEDISACSTFSDCADISPTALGYVNAMAARGYFGEANGKFNPNGTVTRAEIESILRSAVAAVLSEAKEYTGSFTGTVIVNTPGATLKDMKITGDLLIAQGVGNGDVTLRNVTVTGNTIVRGGGANSIHIEGGSQLSSIIIEKTESGKVRVVTADGSVVIAVVVDDGSDGVILTGKFASVTIASDVGVSAVDAQIGSITMSAGNAVLNVGKSSTVSSLIVLGGATGSTVTVDGAVGTLTVDAQVTVNNHGTITTADVNSNNVIIDGAKPAKVNVGSSVTAGPKDKNGNDVGSGSTPSGGTPSGGTPGGGNTPGGDNIPSGPPPIDFTTSTDSSTANDDATLGLTGTSISSSNTGIASAALSGGKVAITSVSAGSATITVSDTDACQATIQVTVSSTGAITIGTITKYTAPASQDQAAPVGLEGVAPSTYGANDGSIIGVAPGMEYVSASAYDSAQPSEKPAFTPVSGSSIDSLTPGRYYVRIAAKPGFNAGATATVEVPPVYLIFIGNNSRANPTYIASDDTYAFLVFMNGAPTYLTVTSPMRDTIQMYWNNIFTVTFAADNKTVTRVAGASPQGGTGYTLGGKTLTVYKINASDPNTSTPVSYAFGDTCPIYAIDDTVNTATRLKLASIPDYDTNDVVQVFSNMNEPNVATTIFIFKHTMATPTFSYSINNGNATALNADVTGGTYVSGDKITVKLETPARVNSTVTISGAGNTASSTTGAAAYTAVDNDCKTSAVITVTITVTDGSKSYNKTYTFTHADSGGGSGGGGGGSTFTESTDNSVANNEITLGLVGTSISSNNTSIADATIKNAKIEITSKGPGLATITVSDGSHQATILVTVDANGAITIGTITKYVALFVSSVDNSTANNDTTLGITGFVVNSSDPGIATAAISGGKIVITSKGAGQATITISDAASHKATISVTVSATGGITIGTITKYVPTSTFTESTDSSISNNDATLGLTGTVVSSSNANIAEAKISGGKIMITSKSAGQVTITVSDAASHQATIQVTVSATGGITIGTITKYVPTSTFTSSTDSSTANNVATLGLIGTSISSSNNDVAVAEIKNDKIAITSQAIGQATITVSDTASHHATISVTVDANGAIVIGSITKYLTIDILGVTAPQHDAIAGRTTNIGKYTINSLGGSIPSYYVEIFGTQPFNDVSVSNTQPLGQYIWFLVTLNKDITTLSFSTASTKGYVDLTEDMINATAEFGATGRNTIAFFYNTGGISKITSINFKEKGADDSTAITLRLYVNVWNPTKVSQVDVYNMTNPAVLTTSAGDDLSITAKMNDGQTGDGRVSYYACLLNNDGSIVYFLLIDSSQNTFRVPEIIQYNGQTMSTVGMYIECFVKVNGDVTPSFSVYNLRDPILGIQEQAPPSGLKGISPTNYDGIDGKITGTTSEMEYAPVKQSSPPSSYTRISGTSLTGLTPGWYSIRYAAKQGFKASEPISIEITNGDVGYVASNTYTVRIDNGVTYYDYDVYIKGIQQTLTLPEPVGFVRGDVVYINRSDSGVLVFVIYASNIGQSVVKSDSSCFTVGHKIFSLAVTAAFMQLHRQA